MTAAPHRLLKDNLSAKHCKHPGCLSIVSSMSACVFLNISLHNIPSIPSPYNCVSESLFVKKRKKSLNDGDSECVQPRRNFFLSKSLFSAA